MKFLGPWLAILTLLTSGCADGSPEPTAPSDGESSVKYANLDAAAEIYVKSVLSLGQHVPGYVDAYYGPPEWQAAAEAKPLDPAQIRKRCESLLHGLRTSARPAGDEMAALRMDYLITQLRSMLAKLDMVEGKKLTFDEESRALYDAVAPHHTDEHFQQILDRLEPLLPGRGSVIERHAAFKKQFVIPEDKLDAVFRTAIGACRERTLRHTDLPPDESFEIEYVTGHSWSAYNWYKGNYHSLIQVNTDLPIYIDRAIDLACHEGYPGHHVYNALLEKNLVRDRGWVEFSVYPLFSPQSLIAEGTANYGIEMAFPGDERVAFEKATLFPLAGLDPAKAELYYEVQELADKLAYAGNEAARRYLDGEIDATAAAGRLTRYALMPPDRAEQRVRFMDDYRSYVINYNLGQDLVRNYVEKRSGGDHDRAWRIFVELLSSPRLPSGLDPAG